MNLYFISTCNHYGVQVPATVLELLRWPLGSLLSASIVEPDHGYVPFCDLEIRLTPYASRPEGTQDLTVSAKLDPGPGATCALVSVLKRADARVLALSAASAPGSVTCKVRVVTDKDEAQAAKDLWDLLEEKARTFRAWGKTFGDCCTEVTVETSANSAVVIDVESPAVVRSYEQEGFVDLGEGVLAELAKLHDGDRFDLATSHAIVAADVQQNMLRVSFVGEAEVSMYLEFEGPDTLEIFNPVLEWLADRNANFRIVRGHAVVGRSARKGRIRDVDPSGSLGDRTRLAVFADFSSTYLPALSHRTISAHIESSLEDLLVGEEREQLSVRALPLYSSPTEPLVDIRNIFLLAREDGAASEFSESRIRRWYHREGGRGALRELDSHLGHFRFFSDINVAGAVKELWRRSGAPPVTGTGPKSPREAINRLIEVRTGGVTFQLYCGHRQAVCVVSRGSVGVPSRVAIELAKKALPVVKAENFSAFARSLYQSMDLGVPTLTECTLRAAAPDRVYQRTALRRFEAMGAEGYIAEKASIDRFPVVVGCRASKSVADKVPAKAKRLKVLDVGCGPGSLSTLLVIMALKERNPRREFEVTRCDLLSERTCDPIGADQLVAQLSGAFSDGGDEFSIEGLLISKDRVRDAIDVIREGTFVEAPWAEAELAGVFDVVCCSFVLHHAAESARRSMLIKLWEKTKVGGSAVLVDESADYGAYVSWLLAHVGTDHEPAWESFWDEERFIAELRNGWQDGLTVVPTEGQQSFAAFAQKKARRKSTGERVVHTIGVQNAVPTLAIIIDGVSFSVWEKRAPEEKRAIVAAFQESWASSLQQHGFDGDKHRDFAGDECRVFVQGGLRASQLLSELLSVCLRQPRPFFVRGGVRFDYDGKSEATALGQVQSNLMNWVGKAEKGLAEVSHETEIPRGILIAVLEREWQTLGDVIQEKLAAEFGDALQSTIERKVMRLIDSDHNVLLIHWWLNPNES